jgi:neurotransmitter:Na+ symporter, NSS family
MDRGWTEMMKGSELKVPNFFFYVIKYVTPTFLLVIMVGYIFQPQAGWDGYVNALKAGKEFPAWKWSGDGMIGKLLMLDVADRETGEIAGLDADNESLQKLAAAGKPLPEGKKVLSGTELDEKKAVVRSFFSSMRMWRNIDRLAMIGAFAFFSILVSIAWKKRATKGKT